ncbi:MAG: hypothetical protein RL689_2163 [Planctomycetota bacterium]|jgi:hypothetical protein
MTDTPRLSPASFTGLAAFVPIFEDPAFVFGAWNTRTKSQPGVVSEPMYILSEPAHRFYRAVYELGWILTDFDWPRWMSGEEAQRLTHDAEAVDAASPEQLARLLTAMVRSDRFCEGALAGCHESGLIIRILRRVQALAETDPDAG